VQHAHGLQQRRQQVGAAGVLGAGEVLHDPLDEAVVQVLRQATLRRLVHGAKDVLAAVRPAHPQRFRGEAAAGLQDGQPAGEARGIEDGHADGRGPLVPVLVAVGEARKGAGPVLLARDHERVLGACRMRGCRRAGQRGGRKCCKRPQTHDVVLRRGRWEE
jgi:hypothetical protein